MAPEGENGEVRAISERYLDSLERSPAPIAIYDDRKEIVFANHAAAEVAGATRPETLVGRSILDFVHPETATVAARRMERVLEDRRPTTTDQLKVEDLRGNVIHLEVTSRPVEYEGTPAAELMLNDVTDYVEHERALQRERDRFETLFENLPTPVVYGVERQGEPIIKRVNPRFEEVFGYEEREVIGENLDDYTVPDDRLEEARRINERVANGDHVRTEVERLTADGRRTFLMQVAMRDDDPQEGYAIYVDITDRRRRKRQLQRERDRLGALFESIPEPVVLVRFEGETPLVERVNSTFEAVFGYDQEDAAGEDLDDLIVPDERQQGAADLNHMARDLEEIEREVRRETTEGLRDFLFRAVPFSTGGDTVESLGVYVDISDQKQRERQLQQQNERLDRFASVVSHDLRNPLTVALGQADLLRERSEADVDTLYEALDRMERIIDDLLTLAREGDTVTSPVTVDVAAVARRAWDTVDTAEADLAVADDVVVLADPDSLQRLFENLFRNAVEHAGEDVTVTTGAIYDESGFYVADDGTGIEADDPERIFERGFSTATEGTGFGLSIVREIVQAHGWTIDVVDEDGARFEVTGVETP